MYKTPKEKLASQEVGNQVVSWQRCTYTSLASLLALSLASPWSHVVLLLPNPCMLVVDGLDHRSTAKTIDPMKLRVVGEEILLKYWIIV